MINREGQRYSQYARRAINQAQLLATAASHSGIDASHLLLGILREESSVGCSILRELGLNEARAQAAWQQLDLPRLEPSSAPTLTPPLQEAMLLAANEARWLGQSYVGTEHLLLGIARLGEPTLIVLLHNLTIDPDQVRRNIRRLLRSGVTEISLEQARRLSHLSELSRRVLKGAEQIAEQLDHKQVGLAHLLLVLAQERRSVCSQILHVTGFDIRTLETDLHKIRPATGGALEDILDRAVEQAQALGSHYTGTEHILLAMTLEARGARLLRKYKAVPAEVESRLRAHLKSG